MPSVGLPPLDVYALAQQLPALINATNLDEQVANIHGWLDRLLPIHGLGVLINAPPNPAHKWSVNLGRHHIRKINAAVARRNDAARAPNGDDPLLFELRNGDLTIVETVNGLTTESANGIAFELAARESRLGTFVLVTDHDALAGLIDDQAQLGWFVDLMGNVVHNTWSHHQNEEKIRFLNLYETVSSSLCYAGDLQELLTSIIAIIVSEIPAEEGSILLYDESTNQLEFFSAIGETGESFIQCCFPADKGVAGKALQEGVPIIVNDVTTCPYFFGDFDNDSGFVTKSILAAPIIVGEEKVGVIEAINKVDADRFEESDKQMLIAIADEVGLAVKNARMFDYVVNSYCKIRQGLGSCKGCVRPLRSWTPCARQLEMV